MQSHLLFLDNLGGGELFVIVLFVLLFFGSDKIPGIMRSLGRAMREFNTAMRDVKSDLENNIQEPVQSVKRDLQKQLEENKMIVDNEIKNLDENLKKDAS